MSKLANDFMKLIGASQFKLTEFTRLTGQEEEEHWKVVNHLLSDDRFIIKASGVFLNYVFTKKTSKYLLMSESILQEMVAKYPGWDRETVNGKEYKEFRARLQNQGIISVVHEPSRYGTKGRRNAGLWKLLHEPFLNFLDLSDDYKNDEEAIRKLDPVPQSTQPPTVKPSSESDSVSDIDSENVRENVNASASEFEKELGVEYGTEDRTEPPPRKSFRRPTNPAPHLK